MDSAPFDELAFFAAIDGAAVRALLIGRRALVVLGLPVMTQDYDYWVQADDAAAFNAAVGPFDLVPNRSVEEARRGGRYVLEGDERVAVLVARGGSTHEGAHIRFDDVWSRRREIWLDDHVRVHLPNLDDLIETKRFGQRPKDAEDIRQLLMLKDEENEP